MTKESYEVQLIRATRNLSIATGTELVVVNGLLIGPNGADFDWSSLTALQAKATASISLSDTDFFGKELPETKPNGHSKTNGHAKPKLSPQESHLYTAMLPGSNYTTTVLSKRTGIKLPSLYDRLWNLQQKGLVKAARPRQGRTPGLYTRA